MEKENMVTFFSGNELVEIALGIERNGFAFYQAMADTTKDDSARTVFTFLAKEEKKHELIFSKLGASLPTLKSPESYPGEQMLYLKSLVDSLVFQNLKQIKQGKLAAKEIEAITIGIQAEKDSILFYTEVENMVKESDRPVVAQVINEEKGHLKQLSALRARIEKEFK
jgi:rubrerythrin